MYARLLEMRRAFGSRRARIATGLHRQRLVLRGHVFRVLLTVPSALAAAAGRQRNSLGERVVAMERASRSGVDRLVTSRPKLNLHERRARPDSHARKYVAGMRVAPRPKTDLSSRDFQRSRTAWTTRRAPARSGFLRAAGVAAAGIAVLALAGIAIVATRNVGSNRETNAGPGRAGLTGQIGHGFLHFPTPPAPAEKAHTSREATSRARRATTSTVRHTKRSVAKQLTLVSNTVQSASTAAAPTTGTVASPSGAGPSPLAAPPGASGPSPLKAPGR
jgi:hypothetical protein